MRRSTSIPLLLLGALAADGQHALVAHPVAEHDAGVAVARLEHDVRAGVEAGPLRHPIRINSYPTLLQAAAAGEGIALGWRHLVDEFLAAGTLVPQLPEAMTAPGAFYLRTTRPVADDSPPGRLRDWFLGTHLQGPVAS